MFVVGIDGGGTKTRVAVCASDGTLLHRETLGAFNLSAIGEDGFATLGNGDDNIVLRYHRIAITEL